MTSPPTWSTSERAAVLALIDALLPASADGRLPAASEVGVADFLARRAADDADFGPQLALCLTKLAELARARGAAFAELAPAERVELVQALAGAEPAAFVAVQRQTYMGYYSHPSIPPRFGMPDHPPQPLGHKQPPDELESLLAPVRARGRRYRDA